MRQFSYRARNSAGDAVSGVVEAALPEAALAMLREQGLVSIEIVSGHSTSSDSIFTAGLRPGEAAEVMEQIATLASAGPLDEGLRAAAAEASSTRLRKTLTELADRVRRGQRIEHAVEAMQSQLPSHVQRALASAARSDRIAESLESIALLENELADLRRTVRGAVAYSLVLATLSLVLFIGLEWVVVGGIIEFTTELQVELPSLTRAASVFAGHRAVLLARSVGLFVALLFVSRLMLGAVYWRRLWKSTPLFGIVLRWASVARATRWLELLITHDTPLDEALNLAADALGDADAAMACRRYSRGVRHGRALSKLVAEDRAWPATLSAILAWGERNNCLAESFAVSSVLLQTWVTQRATLLQVVLPPIALIMIGAMVAAMVVAAFLPLLSLLSYLT